MRRVSTLYAFYQNQNKASLGRDLKARVRLCHAPYNRAMETPYFGCSGESSLCAAPSTQHPAPRVYVAHSMIKRSTKPGLAHAFYGMRTSVLNDRYAQRATPLKYSYYFRIKTNRSRFWGIPLFGAPASTGSKLWDRVFGMKSRLVRLYYVIARSS